MTTDSTDYRFFEGTYDIQSTSEYLTTDSTDSRFFEGTYDIQSTSEYIRVHQST